MSTSVDSRLAVSTDKNTTPSDRHTTSRRPTHDITRHFGDVRRHLRESDLRPIASDFLTPRFRVGARKNPNRLRLSIDPVSLHLHPPKQSLGFVNDLRVRVRDRFNKKINAISRLTLTDALAYKGSKGNHFYVNSNSSQEPLHNVLGILFLFVGLFKLIRPGSAESTFIVNALPKWTLPLNVAVGALRQEPLVVVPGDLNLGDAAFGDNVERVIRVYNLTSESADLPYGKGSCSCATFPDLPIKVLRAGIFKTNVG